MKKVISFSSILAILFSQAGCVGDNSQKQEEKGPFPYATQEIKQQLAENLLGEKGPIPADYFETIDYTSLMKQMMEKGPAIFGEKEKQQVFWYYLMRLRMLVMYYTYPHSVDDWGILVEQLNMLSGPARKFIEENPKEGQEIFASVIAYEEKFPYNPQKRIDEKRAKIKNRILEISTPKPQKEEPALTEHPTKNPGMITWPNQTTGKGVTIPFEEFEKLTQQEFIEKFGIPTDEIAAWSDEEFEQVKHFAIEWEKTMTADLEPWQFIEKMQDIEKRYKSIIEKGIIKPHAEVSLSATITNAESTEEKLAHLQQEMNSLKDIPEQFGHVREQILQAFKNDLDQMKSGLNPEEYAAKKKAERGITEYTIYMQAPKLYPAELFFAEFVLDPNNDNVRYGFRKLFFSNNGVGGTRIEDEKPLPHKVDMMWYSIVENKVYSLQANLPYDTIKEKLIVPGKESILGLLFVVAPASKVDLYTYNTISEEKELLASFQAKEEELSLDDFRQAGTLYENAENPAKDWAEYQQKALYHFPQAAHLLAEQGLPIDNSKLNDLDEHGETRLMNAVRTQKNDLIIKLLTAGADVNIVSKQGTALSIASSMGYAEHVKQLLQAGADVNKPDGQSQRTPLMEAAMSGHLEIVKILVEAGAAINAPHLMNGQDIGYNALKYAQENNHSEIVQFLLEKGAKESKPVVQTHAPNISSLDQALMVGDTAQVKALLAQGANPNTQIPGVGPALLFACTTGNIEAVQALLDAKADVNAAGSTTTGFTPLMMAAQLGNKALVEILLKAGADVNIAHQVNGQTSGLNALKMAQNGGFTEIVELLKSAGAKE